MAGPVDDSPGVRVYTLPFAPGIRKHAGLRRWLAGLRVASVLATHHVHKPILWFYHPSLFALGYSHSDAAIIYDVMDHFPSFEKSDDSLYIDELTLLAEADVAFTGGRSIDRHIRSMVHELYLDVADEDGNKNPPPQLCSIKCIPSGVDLSHFGRFSTSPPRELITVESPRPRFGYFGAIDERMDWDTISQLATATSGSIIIAGPVLKPAPEHLPRNVQITGPVDYANLPELLSTFDVCLIPFKDSPLVHYISPTKTPEYLAGGKPVVSTPIPDVIADYGDVVSIATAGSSFVKAALEAAENPPSVEVLTDAASARAKTWDQIAEEMLQTIMAKLPV